MQTTVINSGGTICFRLRLLYPLYSGERKHIKDGPALIHEETRIVYETEILRKPEER